MRSVSTVKQLRVSLRWICAVAVIVAVALSGCRQARSRAESPTLIEPVPLSTPTLTPMPVPGGAPAMPPAEELTVPPTPSTVIRPPNVQDLIGGFTPAPTLDDEPRLPIPELEPIAAEESDDLVLPPLQLADSTEAGDSAAAEEFGGVGTLEAVPLYKFLKEVPAQPVQLDPSLFLLELFEDELELPAATPLIVEDLPVAIPLPQPTPEPLPLPQVFGETPPPPPGIGAVPAPWPTGGVSQDIVITPGPSVPKWSPNVPYPRYAEPATMPRRLAGGNSDWDLRPIE